MATGHNKKHGIDNAADHDVSGLTDGALIVRAGTVLASLSDAALVSKINSQGGVNASQLEGNNAAQLRDRSTHTGSQAASTVTHNATTVDLILDDHETRIGSVEGVAHDAATLDAGTVTQDSLTLVGQALAMKAVTVSAHGAMLPGDKSKLDGIESGATADQTAGEIKTAYESNANTNAFEDADHSKLDGIEAGATADQTAGEIKTAYESNANTNAFEDADHSKLDGIAPGANAYVHPNHSGDVVSSGDGSTTIQPGVVVNSKLGNMATQTIKGNNAGVAGAPVDLTPAQARAILNVENNAAADQVAVEVPVTIANAAHWPLGTPAQLKAAVDQLANVLANRQQISITVGQNGRVSNGNSVYWNFDTNKNAMSVDPFVIPWDCRIVALHYVSAENADTTTPIDGIDVQVETLSLATQYTYNFPTPLSYGVQVGGVNDLFAAGDLVQISVNHSAGGGGTDRPQHVMFVLTVERVL
jgi:hypothetical protein